MTPSLGLVIPAYQPEIDQLSTYVRELAETLDPDTIRIELDSPNDGVIDALSGLPATAHSVPYRRGKGAAITAGFEQLETDVLAFADADGSTPAAEMRRVVEPVLEGRTDLATGSRRHPDSTVTSHQTFARRHMGDSFAWLARRLLDVDLHDYQCGAKAISVDAWEKVRTHLYESGFAWDVELVAMVGALELRVREVPVEWHDQPGSTVSPVRTSIRLARALVVARHRAKQLRDNPIHTAIAQRRDQPTALVEDE